MIKTTKYSHTTELITDYRALDYNVRLLKDRIGPHSELMPVIKADAYGTGVLPIARKLWELGVRYFAVAFIEEAIELRKAGIKGEILVLYPDEMTVDAAWRYDLSIEVYSHFILDYILAKANTMQQDISIHIKVDTGMHRLGFLPGELDALIEKMSRSHYVKVTGIMSHLASSEDADDDAYTSRQMDLFTKLSDRISKALDIQPLRHILNTGGIVRHFQHAYEISRVGIGLYGIDASQELAEQLEKVHTFQARVIQIKDLEKGDSVSYNRKTTLDRPSRVAVVNVGYADGLPRRVGNRNFSVYTNGHMADIIGTVCMDSIVIDITDIPGVQENDKVEIFGKNNPIEKLAEAAGTIPYEILCGISNRVSRIYI